MSVFFNQNTLPIADKIIMPLAQHQLDMSVSTIMAIKIFDFTHSTPSFFNLFLAKRIYSSHAGFG
ncbi:hypothetical protein FIM67_01415 [Helicobacter pylori]|nr:hypothetical protein FIM67_01415 [Helicobacter pylori]